MTPAEPWGSEDNKDDQKHGIHFLREPTRHTLLSLAKIKEVKVYRIMSGTDWIIYHLSNQPTEEAFLLKLPQLAYFKK